MNPATEKLYALIAALDQAEIRQVRATLNRSDKVTTQCGVLFELMLNNIARDIYGNPVFQMDDETLVVRMFRKGVAERQFHVVRHNLHQHILKTLRQFHEENNREDEIKKLLKNAAILQRKGLFLSAVTELEDALELARNFEYHTLAIEALQGLMNLYGQSNGQTTAQGYAEIIQRYVREAERIAHLLFSENQLFSLKYQALALYRTRKGQPAGNLNREIEQLLAQPVLQSLEEAKSFVAKILYCHTQATINDLKGGNAHSLPWHARVMDLWESEEYLHMRKERPEQFITHLSNYISFSMEKGDFEPYLMYIKELDEFERIQRRKHAIPD